MARRNRAGQSKVKNINEFASRAAELGALIASANRDSGEAFQELMSQPKRGKVRVDLTLPQLRAIERMAGFGFGQMLKRETRSPWRFESRDEAYEAAQSVDALSRLIGLEADRDATDRDMRIDASGDRQFLIAAAFADKPQ